MTVLSDEYNENPKLDADFRADDAGAEEAARGERLQEAVLKGGGRKIVVQKSGIPNSTMTEYLKGKGWKLAPLAKIAEATGVTIDWLATGRGAKLAPQPKADENALAGGEILLDRSREGNATLSDYAILPRYDVAASAGAGTLVTSEQIVEFLAFKRDWLRENIRRPTDKLLLIEARGDSMAPTIRDRDLLVVDTTEVRVVDGAVHVLRMGDNLVVKRLEPRYDGALVIHSDNPRYGPVTVPANEMETIQIVGQVIWQAGPLRS